MEEQEQGVVQPPVVESEGAKDQVDNTPSPEPVVETPVEQPVEQQSPVAKFNEIDEWKNRYYAEQRRHKELQDQLPKLIEETIQRVQPQQKEREFSIAELEQYASQNPEYRPWVEEKKAEILLRKQTELMENRLREETRKVEENHMRRQTFEYVKQNIPEAVDLNTNLGKKVAQYMSNPDIGNRADGLYIASKLAWADENLPKMSQEKQALKQEIKSLQKKQLIEPGGRAPVATVSPHRQAINKLKETGDDRYAVEALKHMFTRKEE